MEEIEITSWLTLDAIKKKAKIVDTVGNLQTDHSVSVFGIIEEDFLELCYSDSAANTLRRYDSEEEFEAALEERKEENGETHYEDDRAYDEDDEDEEDEEEEGELDVEDESESF
jgi:hypothetical protein